MKAATITANDKRRNNNDKGPNAPDRGRFADLAAALDAVHILSLDGRAPLGDARIRTIIVNSIAPIIAKTVQFPPICRDLARRRIYQWIEKAPTQRNRNSSELRKEISIRMRIRFIDSDTYDRCD